VGQLRMKLEDIVHRLRVRAAEAESDQRPHLAADIRLALDELVRLDQELRAAKLLAPVGGRDLPRELAG
jgi:hypothetical protein